MNPPNKYKSIEVEYRESHSRGFIIVGNWFLLVFLTMLFADEIHYKISDKTENTAVLTLSETWKEISEATGLIFVRRRIQSRIQVKYEQTPSIGEITPPKT